jgi:hypothetical protein
MTLEPIPKFPKSLIAKILASNFFAFYILRTISTLTL